MHALSDYTEKIFIDGAEWHINSVWNNPRKEPERGKYLLVEDEEMGHYSVYKLVDQDWKVLVVTFNIIRWAYIEDLTPNKEE